MHPHFYTALQWLQTPPADFRAQVHAALAANDSAASLRRVAQFGMSEAQLHQLGRAFDNSRKSGIQWSSLTPFRLVILSNSTTDHLVHPLVASALRYGIDLQVLGIAYEAAYSAALGGDERVREFSPDAVLVAIDAHGLPLRDSIGGADDEARTLEACRSYLQPMLDGARANFDAMCIVQTFATPGTVTFGNADRAVAGTTARILESLNTFVAASADVVLDIAALASTVGTSLWFDAKLYFGSKMPFALSCVPLYTDHVARVLGALRGKSRRVLVLDLDNTIWGGVVGDDGVDGIVVGNGTADGEAFLALQRKALALRARGILLAVASKNDDTPARAPFRERSEMLLREDSFAAFHANWHDKAASIQAMASELSLGLDSFVFFDDNPAERALVRSFLPEVAVPELPDDPSAYATVLHAAGYFEAVSVSDEDRRRADLYRSRSAITTLKSHDLSTYLQSLAMQLDVALVQVKNRTRVVQLVNKSNQFNLTTRRVTEAEVAALESENAWHLFAFRLTDRLDDHGIISVVFAEQQDLVLDISLWVMSCRVIGRGVERAVLEVLVDCARERHCQWLGGWYLPTARNDMVKAHYERLGFTLIETRDDGATYWRLAVESWERPSDSAIRLMRAD